MGFSKLYRALTLVIPLTVIIAITAALLLVVAAPTETANACLPCYCPEDPTLNCFGDYAIFTNVDEAGVCRVDIYYVASTGGELVMSWTAPDLNNLVVEPGSGALLIGSANNINFVKLESGEYQVSWGPNVENKIFVTTFSACPVRVVRELNYVIGQQPETIMDRTYDPGIPDQFNPLNSPAQPPAAEPTPVPPTETPLPNPTAAPVSPAAAATGSEGFIVDPLELFQ